MFIELLFIYLIVAAGLSLLFIFSLCLLVALRQKRNAVQMHLNIQYQLEQSQQENDAQLDQNHHLQQQYSQIQQNLGRLQAEAEQVNELKQQVKQMRQQTELAVQQRMLAQQELQTSHEKVAYLEQAELRLSQQFELLAAKALDQKEQKLQQQHQQGISQLLQPLGQQLEHFQKQLQHNYESEVKQRHSLKEQIIELQQRNQQMSDDAIKLTQALKGDNKQQGVWGELVLEQVLQQAGLRKGHEYQVQLVGKNQDQQVIKPDVVVHLPDHKSVIIDSKANLTAYERYYHQPDEASKQQQLKEHAAGVKAHIKGLTAKDYPTLYGLNSMDFVLMFMPIEQAYLAAIEHDPSLINYGLDRNILLVSPSSLLVALRSIDNLWRNEHQHRNAQYVAQRAAKLYDKFVAFTQDLQGHGQQLAKANDSYQQAMNKLSQGRGNLIRQAEQLKDLQIPVMKQLDSELIAQSEQD